MFFEKEKIVYQIKLNLYTLWYAIRHQNTPKLAKYMAIFVCTYAFSPIDLIPDFIPVLGYLDDIIIVPLGIYFIFKITPKQVIVDSKLEAIKHLEKKLNKPKAYSGIIMIITLWSFMIFASYYFIQNIRE